MSARPLTIVPVYNEADILPYTVRHLLEQGCDVHLVDNWSTDGSVSDAAMIAMGDEDGLLTSERWPVDGPDPQWQWTKILQRIEEIAMARQGWVMFNDADEIRRSRGETLAEGFARVRRDGMNAVSFQVFEFWPTDNFYAGDPEQHFQFYRNGIDARLPHIKAWFSWGQRVDLHSHGGHRADFPSRKVAPAPWILKHYPIRSVEQGTRKLRDRRARYAPAELARNWHVQYDGLEPAGILRAPSTLKRYA